MNIKNPLYDKMGRFQWNAFLSLFGWVIAPAAFLICAITGSICATLNAGLFFGGCVSVAIAIFIYGNNMSIISTVVLSCFVANRALAPLALGAATGLVLSVTFALFMGYQSPFKRYVRFLEECRRFGQPI